MPKHECTFTEAINQAMMIAMTTDDDVFCYGLGVDDPLRIFQTTKGLVEKFPERVFDMPTAENGMTGIGIGAAIAGMRPVMVHQRLDFFLLAFDQLINSAAKWHYMFNGQRSVPITIRLIIGRGWGQGPTHAQNLHALFAHIPGLKVVMPTTPQDAKQMLLESIFDNNPVVFLEHRWLHNQTGLVDDNEQLNGLDYIPMQQARIIETGTDVTIISMSYLTVEAIKAVAALKQEGLSAELIDLRSIKPIDWPTLEKSVLKTGRLLVLDSGATTGSVAGEIIAHLSEQHFEKLKAAPKRLAMPDIPEPTSYGLTKDYYFGAKEIAEHAHLIVTNHDAGDIYYDLINKGHHDVPGDYFKGPF
ncbi:alpha-ketoacid dehydrogenase subunit beta [Thalassotalea agariperforans]